MQSSSLKVSASTLATGAFANKFKSNNAAITANSVFVIAVLFIFLSFIAL
jgi:hypothetical protein